MDLSKYKNMFGEPGKGAHKYRVGGFAAVDISFVLLGTYVLNKKYGWNPGKTLGGLLLSGIVMHKIFSVDTALNKLLFS